MNKYQKILSGLYSGEILSELEGPSGLLAVTDRELYYITDDASRDTRLSWIKRITRNQETKNVDVLADQSVLMEISPSLFPQEELKSFLESLKGHVLRARSTPTLFLDPNPVPYQAKPKAQQVDDEPISMVTLSPETSQAPKVDQPNFPMPNKTKPDEPSNSMWSYDGGPVVQHEAAPAVALPSTSREVPMLRQSGRVNSSLGLVLKIWAGVTALMSVLFILTNIPGTLELTQVIFGFVLGIGLALVLYRMSEIE